MTFDWYIGAEAEVALDPTQCIGTQKNGPDLIQMPERPHVGDVLQIGKKLYRVKVIVWHLTGRFATVKTKTAAGEEQKSVQVHGSIVALRLD